MAGYFSKCNSICQKDHKERNELEISLTNCKYRGEGNAAVAIALLKEKKVLRLLKSEKNEKESTKREVSDKLWRYVEFVHTVMKPLLSPAFLHCPNLVNLSVEDVRTLNKIMEGQRPDYRVWKLVPEAPTSAIVLQDYCTFPPTFPYLPSEGPVIGVEIKAKQGFLPPLEILPKDQKIKASICRFCLLQHYKVKKGTKPSISQYCPLDLFSGCPNRMKVAIQNLFKTPQNNLRIVRDQEIVYSREKKGSLTAVFSDFFHNSENEMDSFVQLIIQALLKVFPSAITSNGLLPAVKPCLQFCVKSSKLCSAECAASHVLPDGCVLHRILQVQQLDTTDIANLYPQFKAFKDQLNNGDNCLEKLLLVLAIHRGLGKTERQSWETESSFISRKIWEFLLSLSAKDCSIMVVMQRLKERTAYIPDENILMDDNGRPYLFSLGLVDLDYKHLSKIESAYHNDCQAIQILQKRSNDTVPYKYC
ncbi:inositol phosphate kinase 1 isoform X2 [Tachypleus tridentatus]|uniref:inositol phosphate kinase 1 isoform X2 n=1 Tax=Tachypleus tridentatus TaxID=6853 RepID=UPI003FD3E515